MPETVSLRSSGARLDGQVALVTGAAGGIGLSVVRRLVAEGARVLMTDIERDPLSDAAEALLGDGAEIEFFQADLAQREERGRLVPAALDRWGRLDILVNNAAYHGDRRHFLDASDDDFERVFSVNVAATASLCRMAGKSMQAQCSGAIVNIGSIQALLPVATYAAYVASKGATMALTRALAVELSPCGIRVNAVLPGVIATSAFKQSLAEANHTTMKQSMPMTAALLSREGHAEEVAAAVAFLVSAEASFITGAGLPVDGGRSISRKPDPFEVAFGGSTGSGNAE